jgi:preprotein translocase subunit SecF
MVNEKRRAMHKIYTIMFWVSITLMLSALFATVFYGLNFGVDFRGGSVLELSSKSRPVAQDIIKSLSGTQFADKFTVNYAGDNGLIFRGVELSEEQHQELLQKLQISFPASELTEQRFDSVGPIIGQELKSRSIIAIILVLVSITIYIAIVFRKLSRVLSPWVMGVAAIGALLHDIIIPMGAFSLLGHYMNVEISAVFVAAVLTVSGYSVSDTVVIFDRVRENVIRGTKNEQFGAVVHKSIMQTLTRSLNTTMTTLLSLIAIYLFGGESIKYFALALIMGIFLGAYSSIFVASPLLVWWTGSRKVK